MSRRGALVPIHGPLYIVTDDVVHPVGGDEKDPECGLITRRYLQRLVLSQRVRYLREGLLGFLQAFIDSIHHTSEGGGLINARSGTGGVGATRGGALHRSFLVRLLARVNQPYHHAIGHTLILPVAGCTTVTIARIRGELGGARPRELSELSRLSSLGFSVNRGRPPPRGIGEAPLLEHSVQCRASGVRRKGQAMGRRHRRRHRASRGVFQLGRAVVAALIIIVLVLVILRLFGVY